MLRGRGVSTSDDNFDLTEDAAGIFFVVAHNVESASTFTVKSHNLSERLSNNHLEASIKEISKTISIGIEETRSETLVGSVKEGEKVVLGTDIGDLGPLSLTGVNTSRVVSTSVEEDNGSRLGFSEIFKHSVDIETLSLGVEVSVLMHGKSSGCEYLVMVSPGRVGDVNRDASELLQECSENVESTSSRKSLS